MTEFKTVDGVVLKIGRIDRRVFDDLSLDFDHPEPPMRDSVIWDGSIEQIPVYSDPEYKKALEEYYNSVVSVQTTVIMEAIEIVELTEEFERELEAFEALQSIGVVEDVNILQRILRDEMDVFDISQIVFYNSTVTAVAIEEAFQKLRVKWDDLPVTEYTLDGTLPIEASQYYTERMVAANYNIMWHEFCKLTGWEQSEYVALYYAEKSIERLRQLHKA